ncbi:MAG: peptidase T [Velocimicrobium sp.]
MKAYERLLRYVVVATASDPKSLTVPTTNVQFDLGNKLLEELKSLGIEDARMDEKCYVYGSIPATKGYEKKTKIGFIAHMDTAPDFCGENVLPQIIEDYDGGKVVLGTSGRVLDPKNFPHLKNLKGRTLITTDGTTLLGSDDKSGIAEIMTMIERIQKENIPHGKISIGFTPDEEVGAGADHFDVSGFGAEFAYTVDGGEEGEIVYENFNACEAIFEVNGFNVHPGSAKDTMKNAQLLAMEINSMLPSGETPKDTDGYEGFFHLCEMSGNVERASLQYIVRDHSKEIFKARKETLLHIEKIMNERYGEGSVKLSIREQYQNMAETVVPCMHLIDYAVEAAKEIGLEPIVAPERGGTDGARLSFMGLPCPNLGTGGFAFHGPYEHVTVEGMDKSVELMIGIVKRYAK